MIDPAFLDELDRFRTARKRHIQSVFAGEQETRELGEGLTFSDYRRYSPGDDTRLIDWKVYARTGEFFVKQFEAERNFTVHALVDTSGSMGFGEGEANKFDVAAKLGLGFAYLSAAEHNDFRFSVFGDGVDRLDGGRSTNGEILDLVDRCNGIEPAGESDFARALGEYAGTIRSRSLVLVASDFLGDVDDIDAGIEALARNHVVLAHVVAPAELDPPVRGDAVFEDMESEARRRTYFGPRLEQSYRERLEAHIDAVAERGEELGARHELIDTGEDFFDSFSRTWIG